MLEKKSEILNTGNKSFNEIDKEIQSLQIQKDLLLDKGLRSDDPDSIIKAQTYLKGMESNKDDTGNIKAYLYSPENEFYSGTGYKTSIKSLSFDLMRNMSNTPIINSIITTRVDQISKYASFTTDLQKEGWTIRKKKSRFDTGNAKRSKQEETRIEAIAEFLENGGFNQKWDLNDDFLDFIKKIARDSLSLDQLSFECERNRREELVAYTAVDAATIRFMETIDPLHKDEFKDMPEKYGYKPRYTQVWNNKIVNVPNTEIPVVYYPWEMSLGIRNKSTNIRNNGYGTSELEVLVEIVTWMLWGMQYNGNFFKQGSNPKGFFTIEGASNQAMLGEFRSAWRNMMSGVVNSHKVPVFEGGKVSWESMQESNRDMEFSQWNEFLILIACSIYKIDPSELGFQFQRQGQMFGQDGQKERIDHSQDKGLKPLLTLIHKQINKYIVSELDKDYEFIWTGVDLENETQVLDNDKKKAEAGFVSQEDMFEKYSDRKFDPKKDTILNPVYQQAQQAKMMGGEESNEAVDQMTGEEEPMNTFDEFDKGMKDNPIMKSSLNYINKLMET